MKNDPKSNSVATMDSGEHRLTVSLNIVCFESSVRFELFGPIISFFRLQ